ncbi:MAG TPA: PAS domain-containing protein [Stellaceae bacterium]|nr:PAS domain-containing protein [Stellaceae bacterium]
MADAASQHSDEITHPTLVAIYRYWNDKRRGRAMPQRADIDPTEIVRLLPYVFMVGVERDPLRFKYRLIGTAICEFLGRDFTGRTVDATNYSAEQAAELQKINSAVVDNARPVACKGTVFYIPGREWMLTEAILLQLSKDGLAVDIILGAQIAIRPPKGTADSAPPIEEIRIIADPIIAGERFGGVR